MVSVFVVALSCMLYTVYIPLGALFFGLFLSSIYYSFTCQKKKKTKSIYRTYTNGQDANLLVKRSYCCPWKAIAFFFLVGDGAIILFGENLC